VWRVWLVTAAGDAVLAEAYRWVGTTEQPPGSNGGPWWDAFGANYGSWCAAFVSMVVNIALGDGSMCQVDSSAGFMLVSNGVSHQYLTGSPGSSTGLEAQRTPDLQPGDVVNYSWESWRWEGVPGQGGYPVCDGGPYDGWTAGDHTGIASSRPDGAGYFYAVEGNTSDGGSQDNGGMVLERQRHISQVCGWWRPVAYGGTEPGDDDEMTEADWSRLTTIVHDQVVTIWREAEMRALDIDRAHEGAHAAGVGIMRSDENANIIEAACRRAMA